MDSHGAFAGGVLRRATGDAPDALLDAAKTGDAAGLSPTLAALLHVARASETMRAI